MAITLDTSLKTSTTNNTTWTVSYTTSGSNRYLLVALAHGSTNVSGVTYNGVSMSLIDRAELTALVGIDLDFWGLVNPASGTNNIVVTTGGGAPDDFQMSVSSWNGVDQTTPTGTAAKTVRDDQTAADISVNASSASGEVVVDAMTVYNRAVTTGAGQTEIQNSGAVIPTLASSYESGAGTTTMSWSWSSNQLAAVIAIPLKPSGGGGGGTNSNFLMLFD